MESASMFVGMAIAYASVGFLGFAQGTSGAGWYMVSALIAFIWAFIIFALSYNGRS